MKKNLIICLLALALLLAGCSAAQPARLEYIGADAAKAKVLDAAGVSDANFLGVDMSTRDGVDYYHLEFTANGQTYSYDVEALTGSVIESSVSGAPAASAIAAAPSEGQPAPEPSAPSSADDAAALEAEKPASAPAAAAASEPAQSSDGGSITEQRAKEIALEHAGLKESDVTFVKSHLERDDGRQHYDVEFYTIEGDTVREYDYEIDPESGSIRDYDYDAEYYRPASKPDSGSQSSGSGSQSSGSGSQSSGSGSSKNSGAAISADEAKAKALSQVPGATLSDIRGFETDYDDGRMEYEGKIIYNEKEYEFEIDGYSGAIRSWEVESIYDD